MTKLWRWFFPFAAVAQYNKTHCSLVKYRIPLTDKEDSCKAWSNALDWENQHSPFLYNYELKSVEDCNHTKSYLWSLMSKPDVSWFWLINRKSSEVMQVVEVILHGQACVCVCLVLVVLWFARRAAKAMFHGSAMHGMAHQTHSLHHKPSMSTVLPHTLTQLSQRVNH